MSREVKADPTRSEIIPEATKVLDLQKKDPGVVVNTQKGRNQDPLDQALKGELKLGQIVTYGEQVKKGDNGEIIERTPLEWSYEVIFGEKWFVCTTVVGRSQFGENNDYLSSYIKRALDNNEFGLFTEDGKDLGKDDRINTGVTILNCDEYEEVREGLPLTDSWWWLCGCPRGHSDFAFYASETTGYRFITDVDRDGSVRPAFRVESKS